MGKGKLFVNGKKKFLFVFFYVLYLYGNLNEVVVLWEVWMEKKMLVWCGGVDCDW